MATGFGGNGSSSCKYKCDTAANTLQWIKAIADFIRPYSFLINAPVVNFFKDRLWEAVDEEWMECLRKEHVKNLLLIPSGAVQEYWPDSLKKFIRTSRSLAFGREQADLQMVLPGWCIASLNTVLSQGMNQKKKHEVEVLSAIISLIASDLKSHAIVDVGAGQGYLAQVLSFHYKHSVLAIDACSHHGNVTSARSERIKKYYSAQIRKSGLETNNLRLPKAMAFRVLSVDALKSLANISLQDDHADKTSVTGDDLEKTNRQESKGLCSSGKEPSMVLAGLHACGDLSVIMLRTFVECKEVKAVINIGCCYNLLSEYESDNEGVQNGFPMSFGVKSSGLFLGKSGRDLACQSAERWRNLENEGGVHNFELHAFRAAFQMVLYKYCPEVVATCPSVGRQGKALRRRKKREAALSSQCHEDKLEASQSDLIGGLPDNSNAFSHTISDYGSTPCEQAKSVDKYLLFEKFCQSGLNRLGLQSLQDMDYYGIWMDNEPFAELIGPYWSLRAALGPVLETCILLDRLLFLQEQGESLEAMLLPIFDPDLSPRNVAIIARKVGAT
ncbi:methyltransferase-like protein 25 isoform X2 [Cucurbita moschata]|uniref:Methyltransferase-like protein 25 isoform X2 n=1 Tax=Cucurbita moschata TaxID=3662 RepID=A0A6J1F9A6_CUCMO|nr:methyltransferase-like protein 25 isoform X2 [Cucurbita moschata]